MADDMTRYDNFELLVGRHRGLIRRLCWWRASGDEVLCDDLVQECYLALWQRFDMLRSDAAKLQEAAWVVWQCRSVFSHIGRADVHVRLSSLSDLADPSDLSDLSDLSDQSDLSDTTATREVLDDLAQFLTSDEQRLFALMRQDLTDLEIAERLHLKPRTVREHQRQIIEKLRQHTYTITL